MNDPDGRSTAATAETGASTFDYRLQVGSGGGANDEQHHHQQQNDDGSNSRSSSGCCPRLRTEMFGSISSTNSAIPGPGFFNLTEPNGAILSVEHCFAPPPHKRTLAVRVTFLTATVVTLARRYFITFSTGNRFIFFGYLTHWTLVFCALYQFVGVVCTSFRSNLEQPPPHPKPARTTELQLEQKQQQQRQQQPQQRPKFMVRLMWSLYALSAPSSVIVTVMYWTLDYDREVSQITVENIMAHGGVGALIWIDGLIVGLIPLRMRQVLFVYVVAVLFLVWSVVHDLTGIGNGDWDDDDGEVGEEGDGEGDDDAAQDSLYKSLSWSTDPLTAGVVSAVTLLVMVPTSFYVCWVASLWSKWCKFDGSRRPISTVGVVVDQRRYRKGMC